MRIRLLLLAVGLVISANTVGAAPIPLTVGQGIGFDFTTLSAAINSEMSGNSYLITMAPGTYQNDFSVVNQPTDIEAAGPGVILQATGPIPNSQGIIETFANLTVNGLTITGAIASDPNSSAAAIRDHNDGSANANTLIVTNSLIENSQNGIQTQGSGNRENVTIKNDNFVGDGGPIGPAHALYIGDAATADIINSTFCGTVSGHDIKSRALSTTVTGSTMYIAATGTAGAGCSTAGSTSAGIDVPNGGVLDVVNDQIFQNDANSNGAMILYGGEAPLYAVNSLTVSGTSFDNEGTRFSTGIQELLTDGTLPTSSSNCPVLVPNSFSSNNHFTNVNALVNPAFCAAAPVSEVPEPPSWWLIASALSGCWWVGRRSRARWCRPAPPPRLMPRTALAALASKLPGIWRMSDWRSHG